LKLEGIGIAAVPVATHEFMTAARAQAAALGRPEFDAVYVPHPIQDQTKAEIEAKADAVLDELIARLVTEPRL
jgi:alkanesulfonate monooxygenase SsuD/methylene tetrahydromethanopterin reductase-like flavin-dependent oxidoreductase (luciferase family)